MAQLSLNSYMQQLEDSLNNYNGNISGALLSFKHPHIYSPRLQLEKPEASCERWFSPPWDELVAAHLRACYAVANHDFVDAYGCQAVIVQAFVKILQGQKDENWSLPIMFSICVDLRNFATMADTQLSKKGRGKSGETLEKAAELLMSLFRVCASDNRAAVEDSKKWGMLNLVNQLFKIYFKINKMQLCKPLIRAIDSLAFKDKFQLSQLVTYKYYVGRKALFDNDFKTAEEYLSFAFQRCHAQSRKNKRLILIYLLPVKMLLGQLPMETVLRKYDLSQFKDIAQAVRTGNLILFTEAMEKHEAFFIKCGIKFILEKLRSNTQRTLFKKVALLMKTHQLPIAAFTSAFHSMGETDVDDDEVECLLANLINENKIKGYISHQHRKLVVSKQNAFPSLAAVK